MTVVLKTPAILRRDMSVTLDPNNGDDPTEIVVTGGEEASFTIPQDEPTQDGYRFTGWEYGDTVPTVAIPAKR